MRSQNVYKSFFYPSWKVLILPILWVIILISYAIHNPIYSSMPVLEITNETLNGAALEPTTPLLLKQTIFYTLKSILLNGAILYIFSCTAFYLYEKIQRSKKHSVR